MKLKNLYIDTSCFGDVLPLIGISPSYVYANGVKTDETDGHRYTVVIPALGYDRLSVKIPGPQQLHADRFPVHVCFENLEVKPYIINGQVIVSAKATGINVVDTDA